MPFVLEEHDSSTRFQYLFYITISNINIKFVAKLNGIATCLQAKLNYYVIYQQVGLEKMNTNLVFIVICYIFIQNYFNEQL